MTNQREDETLYFPAQKLVAYQVAREVLKEVARMRWPGFAELGDPRRGSARSRRFAPQPTVGIQARRAALSVQLNVGEGASQRRGSGAKRRHYDIALASAGELAAALDAAAMLGFDVEATQRRVARLGALVGGLARR